MNKKENYKLTIKPVPDSCWYSNLRSALPKKIWDVLRKDAYSRADGKCMICGRKTARLEAHEDWIYDEENAIQKLNDIIAICHDCHSVIHIGRTQLMGDEDRAIAHFCKVNKCSYCDYIRELGRANEYHARLNKIGDWKLDVDFITGVLEKYGIK